MDNVFQLTGTSCTQLRHIRQPRAGPGFHQPRLDQKGLENFPWCLYQAAASLEAGRRTSQGSRILQVKKYWQRETVFMRSLFLWQSHYAEVPTDFLEKKQREEIQIAGTVGKQAIQAYTLLTWMGFHRRVAWAASYGTSPYLTALRKFQTETLRDDSIALRGFSSREMNEEVYQGFITPVQVLPILRIYITFI